MDEYLLNDLLECSVCLERLDTSSRVLPCQHTFCKKCLEEIIATKKELRCPECRVLVTKSVDELPPNVLLMRILEGMKNAGHAFPRKKPAVVLRSSPTNSPHSVTTPVNPTDTLSSKTPQCNTPPMQNLALGPPIARALYDYQSLEPDDLCFRKGDMIKLISKIDTHWAHGECSGKTGIFPLTFVQILTPLAPQVATCRALYDFRMNNDEVEGCLSFRKDEVLAVLRRVDENWIEGRLNGRIGIFPLAFVELNQVAKAFMKLSSNEQPGPSRVAPPTPTTEASSVVIHGDSQGQDRIIMSCTTRMPAPATTQTPAAAPAPSMQTSGRSMPGPMTPVPVIRPPTTNNIPSSQPPRTTNSDSTTSSSTTTPNSSINSSAGSSSNSSTAASSPASPQERPSPNSRHSGAISVQHQPASPHQSSPIPNAQPTNMTQHSQLVGLQQQPNSQKTGAASPQQQSAAAGNPFLRPQTVLPTSHITTQQRDKRHSFTAIASNQPAQNTNRHSAEILSASEPVNPKEETTSNARPLTGNPVADSIRSQDSAQSHEVTANGLTSPAPGPLLVRHGSQRHRRSGSDFAMVHLPAAYVALYPYKPQKADELELKKGGVYLVTERCQDGWFKGTSNRTQKCGVFPGNYVTLAKPISNSHSRVVSSSPRDCSTPNPTQTPSKSRNVAVKVVGVIAPPELPPRAVSPVVRHHRHAWNAFSPSTPSSATETGLAVTPAGATGASGTGMMSKLDLTSPHSSHISNTISPPPNVSVSLSPTQSKPTDKVKEKKEKSGLIKRLAAIKRSKSPTVPAYSMDNPVFEDNTGGAVAPSTPYVAHSRSGSCPSQLLHLPVGVLQSNRVSTSLSARVTRQKERPSLGPAHFTQSPSRCGETPTRALSASHRKSSSLDAGDPRNAKHLVPAVRERFRCIVPYPPNSEYELELRVGDIIYVHRKREDGWYKGTQQRTGRTGLFPASFVESH